MPLFLGQLVLRMQSVMAIFLPAVFYHNLLVNHTESNQKNKQAQQTNVACLKSKLIFRLSTYCPNSFNKFLNA